MVAWETVAFAMAIRYSQGDLAGTECVCHGPGARVQEKSRQFLFQFTMSESRFAGFGPNFEGVGAVPLVRSNMVQSKLDAGAAS